MYIPKSENSTEELLFWDGKRRNRHRRIDMFMGEGEESGMYGKNNMETFSTYVKIDAELLYSQETQTEYMSVRVGWGGR